MAGNLATRHGIGVALRRTECPTGGHGVTATVRLPPGLLVAVPGDVPGEVPRRFPARGSRQFLGAG